MSPTTYRVKGIYCVCCDYTAKNRARYMQHLGTTKHGRNYLKFLDKTEEERQNMIYCKVVDKPVQETIEIVDDDSTIQNETASLSDKDNIVQETIEDNEVQEYNFDSMLLHYHQNMNTISIPKVFIWLIHIFFAMRTFFGYNRQNMPQNHLSGNE
tara:strand:- start:576 stop:1040 length:465 start_codon:yes stop_codon:yes gene_type:complete